ncbi:uncharacterized protein LOC125195813 [Salvia hispanica]|uniref:uncharacterized protein LOC125195813 n=1 Tax=Salvia hispanica TaxID=49212 RepID=UPI002009CA70|nr:uncharacterized protein LOC125195813 [Salvia hispanica]
MDRFAKLDKYLMVLIEDIMRKQQVARISILGHIIRRLNKRRKRRRLQNVLRYSILDRMPAQIRHMNRLVRVSDTDCLVNLRMDRNAFGRLCGIFRQLGIIRDKRFLCIEEQVAIFLGVLTHHKKNRIVRFNFLRSGHTVSKYVHEVMAAVIKLHNKFLVKPEPINAGCVDWRWKHFQGCLGALDGTFINVLVRGEHKPKFRNRKGQITTNTLAACDRHMRFTYVLPGWEGSAGDARVLRNAITRPNGFRVPIGNLPISLKPFGCIPFFVS